MRDTDTLIMENLYKEIYLESPKIITEDHKDQTLVTDEHVAKLRNIIGSMTGLGVPTEKNDIGFNKPDWTFLMGNEYGGSGILSDSAFDNPNDTLPVYAIVPLINLLNKYKRTQLTSLGYDYDSERAWFEDNIKKPSENSSKEKIVFDYTDTNYGKIAVTFPTVLSVRVYNKVVDEYCSEKDIQMITDIYGKTGYPRFKFFGKHKSKLNSFYIYPDLAEKMSQQLYPDIEIEKIGVVSDDSGNVTVEKPKVTIIKSEKTQYGEKLLISFGSDPKISKNVYFAIKSAGHTPRLLSYQDGGNFYMSTKLEDYKILKPLMENELDVSVLDEFFDKADTITPESETSEKKTSEAGKYPLDVRHVSENTIRVTPNWRSLPPDIKNFLKQGIKYLFPDFIFDSQKFEYVITGDYEQYGNLGKIFKSVFDIGEFRSVFKKMLDAGSIKPNRIFSLKTPTDIDQKIDETFPESSFDLYGLQKEGVDFLYKNKYAILGSETGGGKTVQLIYAAELVYRDIQKPIVIITVKRVQSQFTDEIISVMGETERSQISNDPMVTKKWNVLYYENFSAGKNLPNVMRHMTGQEYSVIILDELHKLKHDTSKRSQNIELISSKSSSRWGATATVSSNKPQDVKNQLSILGHPIGKMSRGKFGKEFSGWVPEGYNGAYIENPDFSARIMAAENLNKWLHVTGVYIRHSKEDMRAEKNEKMPDIKIEKKVEDNIPDKEKFQMVLKTKMANYKDDDLAISKLIAYRDTIATFKTDSTVSMALDIVNKNKNNSENNYSASKILIFTNFITAGKELLEKSQAALTQANPKWKAFSFLSFTPKKELEQVKKIMEDPDSKILVMSMKMGGTGISFPNTFKTMIVNDYDWTPESVEQSEGRIFRINTNQNVDVIYNLDTGFDSKLYENVEKKKELAKIIQTYRKQYQDEVGSDPNSEALKKIVQTQKQIKNIDDNMIDDINKSINVSDSVNESFKDYYNFNSSISIIKNYFSL